MLQGKSGSKPHLEKTQKERFALANALCQYLIHEIKNADYNSICKFLDELQIFNAVKKLFPEMNDVEVVFALVDLFKIYTDYIEIEASDIEIKNNHTSTFQTIQFLKNMYPCAIINIAMGSDNFKEMKSWKNLDKWFQYIKSIVIIGRNNVADADVDIDIAMMTPLMFPGDTNIPKDSFIRLPSPASVSSTELRTLFDGVFHLEETARNITLAKIKKILGNYMYVNHLEQYCNYFTTLNRPLSNT